MLNSKTPLGGILKEDLEHLAVKNWKQTNFDNQSLAKILSKDITSAMFGNQLEQYEHVISKV